MIPFLFKEGWKQVFDQLVRKPVSSIQESVSYPKKRIYIIMKHDILSDMFTIIRNAEAVGKSNCVVPASNLAKNILKVMQDKKYIGNFEFIDDGKGGKFKVDLIGRINTCSSIKPRFSVQVKELIKWEKRFLPGENLGMLLMTTPKGVIDHYSAKKTKEGGKLLGFVY